MTPKDNWVAHTSTHTCKFCMWFKAKTNKVGRCIINAPTIKGFPVVYETDTCGEHRLNDKALK